MIEWRYWRWQVARNLPLGLVIFFAFGSLGLYGLYRIPSTQIASSQLVLETPLALGNTPKAARSSQDIQHLKVVIHALTTESDATDDALELSVHSGRDKPTVLTITGQSIDQNAAVNLAQSHAAQAIEISDTLQRERIDASVAQLVDLERAQADKLARALARLSELGQAYGIGAADLTARLDALRKQKDEAAQKGARQSPDTLKLRQSLAEASVLHSDSHPIIRVLRARIASAEPVIPQSDTGTLDAQIATAESALYAAQKAGLVYREQQEEVTQLTTAHERSQAALTDARLDGEASFARLKLVQDAHLEASLAPKKLLLAQIATLLLAAAIAVGLIALRIRSDRSIRRPSDLASGLGITPFATLPNLGPSLA